MSKSSLKQPVVLSAGSIAGINPVIAAIVAKLGLNKTAALTVLKTSRAKLPTITSSDVVFIDQLTGKELKKRIESVLNFQPRTLYIIAMYQSDMLMAMQIAAKIQPDDTAIHIIVNTTPAEVSGYAKRTAEMAEHSLFIDGRVITAFDAFGATKGGCKNVRQAIAVGMWHGKIHRFDSDRQSGVGVTIYGYGFEGVDKITGIYTGPDYDSLVPIAEVIDLINRRQVDFDFVNGSIAQEMGIS